MLRKILLVIAIIIVYVLHTTLAPFIAMANVVPNFTMVFVCITSLLRGRREGMIVGFFSGLLLDVFYGYNDIIGINALCYVFVGYINGVFKDIYFLDDINIPMLMVALCDLGYNFIMYVLTFMMRNDLNLGYYLKRIIIPEMVYTVLICFIVYRVIRLINLKLEAFENRGVKKDDNQGII